MKSFKVSSLKAGMIFNKAVYIEGNNILVPPEIPIKQKDLERLISWDISEVFSDGEMITSGDAEKILDRATDYISGEVDLDFYDTSIKNMDEVFQNIQNREATELDQVLVNTVASDIYTNLKGNETHLVQKILGGESKQSGIEHRNLTISTINCTILAAIIGQVLFRSKNELIEVITATLLHDSGMLLVPEAILLKQEKLTSDDIHIIRQHADQSYEIIKQLGYGEKIAGIAAHHHEKWNGEGYQGKLKGKDIPLGSRIIAVTDTYIALVNNRPYRNYLIGYNAMKAILSDNSTHFDPEIIKVFLKAIGIYPIGSIVRLSDQSIGKVTDINSKAPLRPRIMLIRDSSGNSVKKVVEINLMKKKDLFITKAVDPGSLGH